MGAALKLEVVLTSIDCGSCGGTYALNERYRQHAQDNGTSWTCPYCRVGWGFSGTGALQKAEKELAAERERHRATLARANEAEQAKKREEKARKAAEAKTKRDTTRIHAGVCTCCNRTFQNLARHMATKHKDVKP